MCELRASILRDLETGDWWVGEIAEAYEVTLAAAMALFNTPDQVALCRYCTASGFIVADVCGQPEWAPCRHCRGLGYTSATT